jgi:hypothetical protein
MPKVPSRVPVALMIGDTEEADSQSSECSKPGHSNWQESAQWIFHSRKSQPMLVPTYEEQHQDGCVENIDKENWTWSPRLGIPSAPSLAHWVIMPESRVLRRVAIASEVIAALTTALTTQATVAGRIQ